MLPDPYTPPPQVQYEPVTPAVWPWFATYCGVLAFLYFLVTALGLTFLFIDPSLLDTPGSTEKTSAMEMKLAAGIYTAIGLPLFLVYVTAPFLPKRPWVWIYDIVLIALSMSSLCCLPLGIPLLIFWLKDETKAYFNKPVPQTMYR